MKHILLPHLTLLKRLLLRSFFSCFLLFPCIPLRMRQILFASFQYRCFFPFYEHSRSHCVGYRIFDGKKFSISITPSIRDCVIKKVYLLYGAVWHTDHDLYFIVLMVLLMKPTCYSLAYMCRLIGCRKSCSD